MYTFTPTLLRATFASLLSHIEINHIQYQAAAQPLELGRWNVGESGNLLRGLRTIEVLGSHRVRMNICVRMLRNPKKKRGNSVRTVTRRQYSSCLAEVHVNVRPSFERNLSYVSISCQNVSGTYISTWKALLTGPMQMELVCSSSALMYSIANLDPRVLSHLTESRKTKSRQRGVSRNGRC